MRRLIFKNENAVKKHNSYAVELCRVYNICSKLDDIERNWHIIDDKTRTVRIDLLDKQVIGILLNTEKGCRKLRMREVNYSLEISRAAKI